tara:strand:+ start:2171 stop:2428 length:258 start_codon:yes stop_codon:yes gene_type:complete
MKTLQKTKLTYKQLHTYLKDFVADIDTKFVTHINSNMQICINKQLMMELDKKISSIGNRAFKTSLDTSYENKLKYVVYTINTEDK